MKIKRAIYLLQNVFKKLGNVDILIDTEAGTFPVHCVDVRNIYAMDKKFTGESHCMVTLDEEVMKKVHPLNELKTFYFKPKLFGSNFIVLAKTKEEAKKEILKSIKKYYSEDKQTVSSKKKELEECECNILSHREVIEIEFS